MSVQTPEQTLARFVCDLSVTDVPPQTLRIVRLVLLTVAGTAVAGAGEEGVEPLRALLKARGGQAEATSFIYGDRLPAASAAMLNGVMCRALDYCDAMLPGLHIGSSLVPAAFAAAELAGGCSGAEFLAALAAGAELASRLNLSEAQYDGFDPTGVAAVFASTAAASRILRLTQQQTLHALALAFNRCGGSFQSNVDGSLAVRVIQGWVAETGVSCAQLARAGLTGPAHFISGVYGYAHLYGRGRLDPFSVCEGLGERWLLNAMVFKKYPSCGGTQGMTEIALDMASRLDLHPEQIESIVVRVRPYTFKLVGHRFVMGDNPRVDAQFSAQYCVASAFVRRHCELSHFRPQAIVDRSVLDLLERVTPVSDESLSQAGQPCAVMRVKMRDGQEHESALAFAPGFPGNELTDSQHRSRLDDCMRYAPYPLARAQIDALVRDIEVLSEIDDARALLQHFKSEAIANET
ncbi:MAG: MmgE/PrpD family protein [Burkholderiaceae bacterium]|nr:MmgE/PrpD family protein [Burkholderiaceae bacterium]